MLGSSVEERAGSIPDRECAVEGGTLEGTPRLFCREYSKRVDRGKLECVPVCATQDGSPLQDRAQTWNRTFVSYATQHADESRPELRATRMQARLEYVEEGRHAAFAVGGGQGFGCRAGNLVEVARESLGQGPLRFLSGQ